MHVEIRDGIEVIVCTVGKTVLLYDAPCQPPIRFDGGKAAFGPHQD